MDTVFSGITVPSVKLEKFFYDVLKALSGCGVVDRGGLKFSVKGSNINWQQQLSRRYIMLCCVRCVT